MQKDLQNKLSQSKKDNFLVVVDFAGTLFALGPDKDNIKDPFIPDDAEIVLGAKELDPIGCQHKKMKPFQKGVKYGWTVIPSVAQLLYDIQGVNVIASSVAGDKRQALLQKTACRDNHVHINHITTKDAEAIVSRSYCPSTIVVLGDSSSDVMLAEKIAELSPHAKVVCGFTPSGMEQHKTVQDTLNKHHPNIEFISGENWSVVIRKLRKRLPIRSRDLRRFKEIRQKGGKIKTRDLCRLVQNKRQH